MQSGILHRDTTVETRVDVLVFAHGPRLRSASTAHGIGARVIRVWSFGVPRTDQILDGR